MDWSDPASRARIRRRVLVLGGLLLLLAAVSAWPLYQVVREARAESMARRSAELVLDEATAREAWELAQAAHQLAPENLPVIRNLARMVADVDPSQAVEYWIRVVAISEGDPADLAGLIDVALKSGRLALAKHELERLEARAPDGSDLLRLTARWFLQASRAAEGYPFALELASRPEATHEDHLIYVRVGLSSSDPAHRGAALRHLKGLAEREDRLGLVAVRFLVTRGVGDAAAQEQRREVLFSHPEALRSDRLLALSLRLREGEAIRDAVVADVLAEFDVGLPDDRVAAGRWLLHHGFLQRVLELFPEELARTRADYFAVWVDTLAVGGQWDRILAAVEDTRSPLYQYERHLYKTRAYWESGDERRSELEWSKLMLSLRKQPQVLWNCAEYARAAGMRDWSRQAYAVLTEDPQTMRRAYERLIQKEQKAGDTLVLAEVVSGMADRYPAEPAVRNDVAYLNLLLQRDVGKALATARQLIEENSPYLAHHITYALGLWRTGESAEALAHLDALPVGWSEVRDSWRVVYALLLREAGRSEEADVLAAGVRPSDLLPEEVDLYLRAARRLPEPEA